MTGLVQAAKALLLTEFVGAFFLTMRQFHLVGLTGFGKGFG